MNGTAVIIIVLLIAIVAVIALIRRAKRKSTAAQSDMSAASPSTPLRSAIVTPGEQHSPATASAPAAVNTSTAAAVENKAEPEPEEAEPTAAQIIAEGDEHKHSGDYDAAIESYEAAVDSVTAEHGRESLEFADLLVKTEDAYFARDNEDDDEINCNNYLRALSIMERCVGAFDTRLLPVINRIVSFYLYEGKVTEAESLVRRQQLIELRAKQAAQRASTAAPAVTAALAPSAAPVIASVSTATLPSGINAAGAESDVSRSEPSPAVATISIADAHKAVRAALATGNSDVDNGAAAGDSARAEFDYDTAVDHYQEALEAAQTGFGRDSIQLVPILIRLGEACHLRDILDTDDDGDAYSDPLDRTRLALSLLVRDAGMQDTRLVPVLTNMVAFSDQVGDHFKADRYLAMIDNINEASHRIALR